MKKMLPWLIMILTAITLIAVAAIILWNYLNKDNDTADAHDKAKESVKSVEVKKLTADELVEVTSELKELRTNLSDRDSIVILNLAFQLDDKKTKEQFDKIIDIEVKPIIISVLSDTNPDQISSAKGKDELCAKLLNLINPVLTEGKINKIKLTNFIIAST